MRGFFDPASKEQELLALQEKINSSDIWSDQQEAQKLLKAASKLESELKGFQAIKDELSDINTLVEIADEENDDEAYEEIAEELKKLQHKVSSKKTECLFSGEADENDCFIEIHSGAGGTESNDWAEMLMRMYMRWGEIHHNFKLEIVSKLDGDEVGIKSVIIKVTGDKAYGWCKTENGVHRLVRISPFDSNAKRHTSFASVSVSPITDNQINVEINESDVRIDTYRASGAGGQHINKTDSAVRITHIPTNIVVQCQNSRSQHRNKAEAYDVLKSKLYELELREKEEKLLQQLGQKAEIGWGQQIRSYVMQPYQLVKDLRTKHETGNVNAVLDGDLDQFISLALSHKINL